MEVFPDSFDLPACSVQPEAMKRSYPRWSLGKETRDDAKKVFISKDHKTDSLGRWSPGPVYTPTEGWHAPRWSFSKAEGKQVWKQKYPPTSADLTGLTFDSQSVKFERTRVPQMGTESRDSCKNQPDLETFIPGAESPGPQAYDPNDRRGLGPKYTMGPKTKLISAQVQTPVTVGPAKYPVPGAIGKQPHMKKSMPQWSFSRQERFPRNRDYAGSDAPLRDGGGNLALKYKRGFSSPAIGFGTSTRDMRKKMFYNQEHIDKGPAAEMGKPTEPHPRLAARRDIIRYAGPTNDCEIGRTTTSLYNQVD